MRKVISFVFVVLFSIEAGAEGQSNSMAQFGINPELSFSGTRHIESKDGQIDMFVRHASKKMRMEMAMAGQTMTVITREDLGVNYMLMPQLNGYREVKTNDMMVSGENLSFSEVSPVGREVVSGTNCTKYRAKFTDPKGSRAGGYYWVSDDGILMKVDMIYQSRGQKGQRMVLTMRDVQIGAQDPSHFEVPANYSKLGFGGLGQMMGLTDDMENVAKDEANQTIVEQTRKKVRKGLGKLFGKD